jgi:hypothetical protein
VVPQLDIPIAWNTKLRFALPSAILVHCRLLDSADSQSVDWRCHRATSGMDDASTWERIHYLKSTSLEFRAVRKTNGCFQLSPITKKVLGAEDLPRKFLVSPVQSYSRNQAVADIRTFLFAVGNGAEPSAGRTPAWTEPRILGSVIVGCDCRQSSLELGLGSLMLYFVFTSIDHFQVLECHAKVHGTKATGA